MLDEAREALRLVQVDPTAALDRARLAAASARAAGSLDAASVAERALGLASMHVQDLAVAAQHLRSAMALGTRAGSPQLTAEARMTYAFLLARQGRPARALTEIESALTDLDGSGRARATAQRGAINQQLGRLEEALADYRVALPALRRTDDHVWVQRVLLNRGLLHAFQHSYGSANRDLQDAVAVCRTHGLVLPAAFAHENLVLVHRRLGDVPRALEHLAEAERLYRSVDAPIGTLLIERSELLLSVRLFAEAREAATGAVEEFARQHRQITTPEARLLLSQSALLDGDPVLAEAEARRAVREFQSQGRVQWVALARCAVVLARLETRGAGGVSRGRLVQVASAAEAAGWPGTALELRLRVGKLGLAGSRRSRPMAREQLTVVSAARFGGPADRRAKGWLALALLRADDGDRAGATAASRHGLRIIEEHRGTLAATDLRASVSGYGVELAQVGLRDALAARSARRVLDWAERGRARHLLSGPARTPGDPQLADLLAELRAEVARAAEARKAGRPHAGSSSRQVTLERAIRDATRRGMVAAGTRSLLPPSPETLSASLGQAALVELVELDDSLHAVSVIDGRPRLRRLGPMGPVRDLTRWLPFALSRLSRHRTSGASSTAAVALLRHTAEALDALLLAPLHADLDDRPLVIVPTGILQSMPWSTLPSLRGRPVTVAPSAALWHEAATRPATPGHALVVAGPGLAGGRDEAGQVAALHGTRPLLGEAATVEAVSAALEGAALLHLAAHGTVRADNPLFSALQLHDGPLTVYDLERVRRGADTVVLAACEGGRPVVVAGDEMLGLSAAFLGRETRHVVASVVPVPDAATTPLMVGFHERLAQGVAVATALCRAQQEMDDDDPAAFAAAAGFVCIGAGFDSIALRRRPVRQSA